MRNGVQEVTGMVIKSMPVGERDRRVTLMTMEQGKLSFFARGAGKPGSPFMGVTRPFSYGKFSLFQGRDSYSLEGAEIVNYFEKLSADLVTTCYATYFLELADYYARTTGEGDDAQTSAVYPLRPLSGVSATATGDAPADFVATHYGDWPMPETLVVNTK